MKNKIVFGTGGWRAVIGDDFVKENINRVAAGMLKLMEEENKLDKPVIIGFDRRFLSETAAKWVAEVLAQGGVKVWFLNRSAPTPFVMHTVLKENLYYGIEITASHNPSNYNGIKLIIEEGRDADIETTNKLEKYIDEIDYVESMDFDEAVEKEIITYLKNPFNNFIDDILGQLDLEKIKQRGLRVLFDPMHGSGAYPLTAILYSARLTVDTQNTDKDAYFGGMMPAPTKKTLEILAENVVNGKYDLGIALDGDGDRLGIIDSNGKYIDANEILCMLYYYLVKYKGWKGPVVRNIATTHMLDKIAESFGEKCYEVPVGFKHISSKIDEVDAVLGGESSGGLTVRGHIHGKDSVYASSLFVEMISVIDKTPTELMEELRETYGNYVMVEENLRFKIEEKDRIKDILFNKKELPEFFTNIKRVSYEDGCKVYFEDDSFVICRFSGTEPLLRIFAENNTKEKAFKYIEDFKNFLNIK